MNYEKRKEQMKRAAARQYKKVRTKRKPYKYKPIPPDDWPWKHLIKEQ